MDLLFIPAIPKGDLRLLDEAIGIAAVGHPALNWEEYEYADGQVSKRLRIGRYLVTIGYPPAIVRALQSIHAGLKAAEIEVLVQDRQTKGLYRVPRTYWFTHGPVGSVLELDPDDPDYLPGLDRQPLFVDSAQQERWIEAARPDPIRLVTTEYSAIRSDYQVPPLDRQKGHALSSASEIRGKLPPWAARSHRYYEDAAHAAAEKVRSGLRAPRRMVISA